MPLLMQDLGLTKSDLGILSKLLALSYGASKFLSGVISDGLILVPSCLSD